MSPKTPKRLTAPHGFELISLALDGTSGERLKLCCTARLVSENFDAETDVFYGCRCYLWQHIARQKASLKINQFSALGWHWLAKKGTDELLADDH